ncbi:MAG: T9SS type A sorting domain-containing protein [Reichenbachiella sp.]
MKRLYLSLFALGILLVTNRSSYAVDYDVTIIVNAFGIDDVSAMKLYGQTGGGDLPYENFNGIDMNDNGDGTWSVTKSISDNATFFEVKFRYWDTEQELTIVESIIPDACGSSGNNRFLASPSENTTHYFRFDGCYVRTYESSSWDTAPSDYDHIIVNESASFDSDLTITGAIIPLGNTLSVSTNSTLSIEGNVVGTSELIALEDEDFESSVVGDVATTGDATGDIALSISATEGVSSSKALAIGRVATTSTNPADGRIGVNIMTANISTVGTYKFTYWMRTDISGGKWCQTYWRHTGWNQNDGATNPTITETWTEYTRTIDVTSTGQWVVDMRIVASVGNYYIDNISVEEVIAGTGDIVIESGSSLITNEADGFDAVVTFERNTTYATGKYSFVGSPVQADPSILGGLLGPHVYSYNEVTGYDGDDGLSRWEDATSTELVPGVGYAQAGQQAISFTGVPNSGDIVVSGLTKSTTGTASTSDQGWHLLSNPYGAALNIETFLADNSGSIAASIALWDDGGSNGSRRTNSDYRIANSIGSVSATNASKTFGGYIGSMQGFMVQASSDNVDVTFNEDQRVSGQNTDATFLRQKEAEKTPEIKIALQTTDGLLVNEVLVATRKDATLGLDQLYDAPKISGNSALQFYGLIEGNRYAIQALPILEGASTELAFDLEQSAELEVSVVELSGLEEGMTFTLTDNISGISYDMNEIDNFSFQSAEGTNQNRFTLTYQSSETLLADELTGFQPLYRYADNILSVDFNINTRVSGFSVYDFSGKVVTRSKAQLADTRSLNIPIFNSGLYIVKIGTDHGVITRKFQF